MFHKSAKGKIVNFDELVHKNATTIAVGNANLNARGDLVGRGGQVIETAEQRNAQSDAVITTTSRVSIQSEITSLKNARNQWVSPEVTNEAPVVDTAPIADVVDSVEERGPDAAKKPRKIVESE